MFMHLLVFMQFCLSWDGPFLLLSSTVTFSGVLFSQVFWMSGPRDSGGRFSHPFPEGLHEFPGGMSPNVCQEAELHFPKLDFNLTCTQKQNPHFLLEKQ